MIDHSDLPQKSAERNPGSGPVGSTPQIASLSPELGNQQVNKAEVSILIVFPESPLSKKAQRKPMPATLSLLARQFPQTSFPPGHSPE